VGDISREATKKAYAVIVLFLRESYTYLTWKTGNGKEKFGR